MKVKRFADAKPYEAANHFDVKSLRLQGFEEDGPKNFWCGLSYYLPGAKAGPDSSPLERVYVVLDGELAVTVDGKETVLKPMDSCYIPPNEVRAVNNRTNNVVTLLVILPYPPKQT